MIKSVNNRPFFVRSLTVALALLFAGAVAAWTGPSSAPPNGNVAAPINVSGTAQVKSGGFWASSVGSDTGYCIGASCITSWPSGGSGFTGSGTTNYLTKFTGATSLGNSSIYDNGTNVGIGTVSPGQKLDVAGYVKGTGLCIGGDCITSWAGAGGVGGSGTTGYVPRWTASGTLGNSSISSDGSSATSNGNFFAPIIYDSNNTGYYVDPSSMSNMERVDFSYGYDRNNTGYYIDLDNRTNLLNLTASGDVRATIFYDQNNTGYYVDPSSMSNMERVDFSYGYDRNNTGYYIDLDNRTNLLNLTASGDVRATIFYDQNNTGYYLDPNGYSNLYAMQPYYSFNGPVYDYNNGGYYLDPNGNSSVVNLYSQYENTPRIDASIVYDRENTNYYVDPNSYSNVYAMQPYYSFNGPVYDYNNGGYYVDPDASSRINYITSDNIYNYGYIYTNKLYKTGGAYGIQLWYSNTPTCNSGDFMYAIGNLYAPGNGGSVQGWVYCK